jgi:hypothetical protein
MLSLSVAGVELPLGHNGAWVVLVEVLSLQQAARLARRVQEP